MELYYQNETLYVDILRDFEEQDWVYMKEKIFRIIEDYGITRIIIQNYHPIFHNRHYLRQMKQAYEEKYHGEFLIR